jgi:glucokinase
MTRVAIGVDVGGTAIKAALVGADGHVLKTERVSTPRDGATTDEIVGSMIEVADRLRSAAADLDAAVEGVGFGVPNYSIGPDWVQTLCSNMPALEGFALYPPLRDALGSAIACELDTHAATLAEVRFGAAAGCERVLNMVIGTGISCGVVIDGRLLRYSYGTSGDTGHVVVDPSGGRACTCGGRGCLEAIASGRAIREMARHAARTDASTLLATLRSSPELLEASDVGEAARRGDETAASIIAEAGVAIGVALTSLIHVFRPHIVLLGGGVAEAGELLLEPARRTIERLASPFYLDQLEGVRRAALGSDAGAIGAATLVLFP